MNVLVTGAAGRLGSATCLALVAKGHRVAGIDIVRRSVGPSVALETVDLLDADRTATALGGAEVLVHLANHVTHVGRPAQTVYGENCAMNINVFEAARLAGVRLIVFASSVHAFTGGRPPTSPLASSEIHYLPLDGRNPWYCDEVYGLSKIAGEQALQLYERQHGIAGVSLRFPRLIPEPPPPEGWPVESGALLDEAFTWLTFDDCARLIAAIVDRPPKGYRCYFPASLQPWTRDGTVEELRRRYFPEVPLRTAAPLGAFVDLSEIREETGWEPQPPT